MNIIKRNGVPEPFDEKKILKAITKANDSVSKEEQMNEEQMNKVLNTVVTKINNFNQIDYNDMNDIIEKALIRHNRAAVAKSFILFRAQKQKESKFSDVEEQVISLLHCQNDDVFTENANKIATRTPVMQNYAGETVLKSIARKLIPEDIIEAHNKGIIHVHDLGNYYLPEHNCDLLDIEDCLENGFAMGIDTMIEVNDETTFSTIGNLVSQIHLNVANTQYGGISTSVSHVVKYIDKTRQLFKSQEIEKYKRIGLIETIHTKSHIVSELFEKYGSQNMYDKGIVYDNKYVVSLDDEYTITLCSVKYDIFEKEIEKRVREEIHNFIKIFTYQLLSHLSSGQTPFCSTIMCLMESENEQELKDYAILIEEMFNRRLKGMKQYNMELGKGLWGTPLFPKLIYFVEEGWNLNPEDPYYYLTELAAKCISLRMQPDIMSSKISRQLKDGLIIGTMGCRSILPPYFYKETYPIDKEFYWVKMDKDAEGVHQYPYGTWVDKKSFKDIPNGKYETGLEHGEYCINFRGNPGWVMEKTDTEVTVWRSKVYGRFNCGVTSLNIPWVALEAKKYVDENGGDLEVKFWECFDEKLELCHRAMLHRFNHVSTIQAQNAPILWIHGALTRMKPEQTVGEFLKGKTGYASISLGYVGLSETSWIIKGVSNTHPDGHLFCEQILKHMNEKCAEWKAENPDSGFAPSVYGTPQENLVKKIYHSILRDYGVVHKVTDKGEYITNSYHVDPAEKGGGEGEIVKTMTAIVKLDIEKSLQNLSTGGAISYIEFDDTLTTNTDAIVEIIRYMGNNIMYAEFNRQLSTCFECGSENSVEMRYEDGKYKFRCKVCGNEDEAKMNIFARICGYLGKISSGNTTTSRLSDIYARIMHVNCETEFPEEVYKK